MSDAEEIKSLRSQYRARRNIARYMQARADELHAEADELKAQLRELQENEVRERFRCVA